MGRMPRLRPRFRAPIQHDAVAGARLCNKHDILNPFNSSFHATSPKICSVLPHATGACAAPAPTYLSLRRDPPARVTYDRHGRLLMRANPHNRAKMVQSRLGQLGTTTMALMASHRISKMCTTFFHIATKSDTQKAPRLSTKGTNATPRIT